MWERKTKRDARERYKRGRYEIERGAREREREMCISVWGSYERGKQIRKRERLVREKKRKREKQLRENV
jgi:hypothetical protein